MDVSGFHSTASATGVIEDFKWEECFIPDEKINKMDSWNWVDLSLYCVGDRDYLWCKRIFFVSRGNQR